MLQRRVFGALLALCLMAVAMVPLAMASTSERFISDPNSGLALHGFDAVAYFIDRSARPGLPQYEFSFSGLTWRFRSEANRAAFAQAPHRYAPAFGGYDPLGVGEGVPLPGNPAVFLVHKETLLLFARQESLMRFRADPEDFYEAAVQAWPIVEKKLVP